MNPLLRRLLSGSRKSLARLRFVSLPDPFRPSGGTAAGHVPEATLTAIAHSRESAIVVTSIATVLRVINDDDHCPAVGMP